MDTFQVMQSCHVILLVLRFVSADIWKSTERYLNGNRWRAGRWREKGGDKQRRGAERRAEGETEQRVRVINRLGDLQEEPCELGRFIPT